MAVLEENTRFSGTIGNVTFYQWCGKSCIRKKSSLTRKRVLKSKAFEKTRQHARDLGRAARIGAEIYRMLPGDIKDRWLYRAITGEAASLLYAGKGEQEVRDLLWKKYIEDTQCAKEEVKKTGDRNIYHSTRESNIRLRAIFRERWEKQGRKDYYFKQAWDRRGYFNRERFQHVLDMMEAPWNQQAPSS